MKLLKNRMLQASSVLFVLNMLASVLNYVCQLLMAKVLSVEAFGTVNTIFSFMLVVAVPGTTLTMIVAKYYAETMQDGGQVNRAEFLSGVVKYITILTVIVFIVCLIVSVPLSHVLAIDDKIILIYAFILGALGFYQPVYSGVFSGKQRFILVGIYALFIPIYKIIAIFFAGLLFPDSLYRLYTILLVMVLGTIATAFFGHLKSERIVGRVSLKNNIKIRQYLQKDNVNILILNLCLMLYMNIDLFAIRYRGTGEESGLYSAVLLFGRIIYYFSTTLGTILLPMAVVAQNDNKKCVRLINRTLALMLLFAMICMIPINIYGKEIIELIYGKSYNAAWHYTIYVSLISVVLSVCTLLANYLAGIGQTKFASRSMVLMNIFIFLLLMLERQVEHILFGIGIIGAISALLIYLITIGDLYKKIGRTKSEKY